MLSSTAHVGGVTPRKRGALVELLRKYPDAPIFAFKDDPCLHTVSDRKVNLELVDLIDPTPDHPWSKENIQKFHNVATEAAQELCKGKSIVAVCVMGKNRSRALAIAAHVKGGLPVHDLDKPPCEHLLNLANTVGLEDALELAPLPPPRAHSRPKRSRAA